MTNRPRRAPTRVPCGVRDASPVSVTPVKRAVLIASGVVLVLLGLLLIAAGGAAAALFGSDGSLSTAPARVSGSGVALVVEDISIDASSIPVPDGVGSLTLSVADTRGRTMFVGSAPSDTVDTYLTGAPYDVVVSVAAGSDATTREVPGTQQPPPPTTQSFWTRQATGSPAELTARVSAATTLVVMNADATPGVDAELVVTLTVARAWTAAWIAVGVGVLLLLLAILAFWRARVAGRRARAAAAAAAPPAAAAVVAAPGATILPGETLEAPAASTVVAAAPEAPAAPVTEAVVPIPPGEPVELAPVAPAEPDATADLTAAAAAVAAATASDAAEPPASETAPDAESVQELPDAAPEAVETIAPEAATPIAEAAAVAALAPAEDPASADGAASGPAYDAAPHEVDAPVEEAASPVDMAALFAPSADDATAVIPAVSAPVPEPADPDTTGPVAPAETEHPAG